MTNSTVIYGWTEAPNIRGTLDIVWNSILTISLCSWTALCLNIPPKKWATWKVFYHKFLSACLCVAGPEFIFQSAFGQWYSARCSVKAFKSLGHDNWTMKHAFLASMGGFLLDVEDCSEWPLDVGQLHYLVAYEYIPYEDINIPLDAIEDRNKSDGLVRILTLLQICWFILNIIARATQHLAITLLEITTLGFIVPTLGTYFFWYHKPMDIRTQVVLRPKTTIAEIFEAHKRRALEAGEPIPEHSHIPLDFVGRDVWSFTKIWSSYKGVARSIGLRWAVEAGNRRLKIKDDYCPSVPRWGIFLSIFTQSCYAGVHAIGWNFYFPSVAERTLWHFATLVTPAAIVIYWSNDLYLWRIHDWLAVKLGRPQNTITELEKRPEPKERSFPRRIAAKMRNNSHGSDFGYDPRLSLPLTSSVLMMFTAAVYVAGRLYVIVACFLSLRALPASAFQTVEWTDFIPHVH